MEIAVLSDTHVSSFEELPKEVQEALVRVDFIVHGGDYTGKALLNQLQNITEFKGVYGNMDSFTIKSQLKAVEVFKVGDFKIGVTHPAEGGPPFRLKSRIRKEFGEIDLIIYGHSHWAKNEKLGGIIYFNPGSATGKFPARYKSYGIINIENEIKAKIVHL